MWVISQYKVKLQVTTKGGFPLEVRFGNFGWLLGCYLQIYMVLIKLIPHYTYNNLLLVIVDIDNMTLPIRFGVVTGINYWYDILVY